MAARNLSPFGLRRLASGLGGPRCGGQAVRAVGAARQEMGKWVRSLANLVYPPACLLCGTDLEGETALHLCATCRRQLTQQAGPTCARCAMPRPAVAQLPCPWCRRGRFRFAATHALGRYDGLRREAVLRMKHRGEDALILAMGRLLVQSRLQHLALRPTHVVPIPMHWSRRWRRGVNPAEVLAEAIVAEQPDLRPLRALRAWRRVGKQGLLSPAERRQNVRHAYRLSAGYDLRGVHILLVDDIMTTGATANAASRLLLQAGARTVQVAVAARGTGGV